MELERRIGALSTVLISLIRSLAGWRRPHETCACLLVGSLAQCTSGARRAVVSSGGGIGPVVAPRLAHAMVIWACSGGDGGSTAATKVPSKVGQTITADNVSCTLVSVKKLAGDEFTKPKAGNQFIVVRVKIENKSDNEVSYNPFDFHAKSSSGNITDFEVAPSTYTDNKQLDSGKLAKGGTVEGDIIFQVPVDDHGSQLTWQPSFFGNNSDYVWALGL